MDVTRQSGVRPIGCPLQSAAPPSPPQLYSPAFRLSAQPAALGSRFESRSRFAFWAVVVSATPHQISSL